MSRSNCLFYAARLYLRRRLRGTDREVYLKMRGSRLRWWLPHFLVERTRPVTGTAQVVSYKPLHPETDSLKLLFQGAPRFGDELAQTNVLEHNPDT